MRIRLIAFSVIVPLGPGFIVALGLGLPVHTIFVLAIISGLLVVRCWRLGLESTPDHLIIRRVFSTDVVPLDAVVSASFGKPFSPGFPIALVVQLHDGRKLEVRGVSKTSNFLPLETKTADPATNRVAEFLERAQMKQ